MDERPRPIEVTVEASFEDVDIFVRTSKRACSEEAGLATNIATAGHNGRGQSKLC